MRNFCGKHSEQMEVAGNLCKMAAVGNMEGLKEAIADGFVHLEEHILLRTRSI